MCTLFVGLIYTEISCHNIFWHKRWHCTRLLTLTITWARVCASSPGWRSLLTIASWSEMRQRSAANQRPDVGPSDQWEARCGIIQHSHTCGSHGDQAEMKSLPQLPETINLENVQWSSLQLPEPDSSIHIKCVSLRHKTLLHEIGVFVALQVSRLTNEKQYFCNFDVRKHSTGFPYCYLLSLEVWRCGPRTVLQVMSYLRMHPQRSLDLWHLKQETACVIVTLLQFFWYFSCFSVLHHQ